VQIVALSIRLLHSLRSMWPSTKVSFPVSGDILALTMYNAEEICESTTDL
jgi:hypothetical protein